MSERRDVDRYIEAIDPAHRPLFDRLHALITAAVPAATARISYGIPTFEVGRRRLYVGVWQHGISLYGWQAGSDGGFTARHPELVTGKGTIRLGETDAGAIPDAELTALFTAALAGP